MAHFWHYNVRNVCPKRKKKVWLEQKKFVEQN